jgi:hypothetical protein
MRRSVDAAQDFGQLHAGGGHRLGGRTRRALTLAADRCRAAYTTSSIEPNSHKIRTIQRMMFTALPRSVP